MEGGIVQTRGRVMYWHKMEQWKTLSIMGQWMQVWAAARMAGSADVTDVTSRVEGKATGNRLGHGVGVLWARGGGSIPDP